MSDEVAASPRRRRAALFALLVLVTAGIAAGVTALLIDIAERKAEGRDPYVVLRPVTEDDTDPAVWGINWPRQYDSYLRTALATHAMTYQEASAKLHDLGHAHPVSCVDCHEPNTMRLRVTRPGFLRGIAALAASDAPTPHLPSIDEWRTSGRKKPYDPNADGRRSEMRSYVCAQCHVEYYCGSKMSLTFPWGKGLKAEDVEGFWDATTFDDGSPFFDFEHGESGAKVLKAQHPEFELWSQGVHARSGVSCADCHMPYMREGATKVSDHWVRSPLLNVNRSCQVCHHVPEAELKARVDVIQQSNSDLLERAAKALMDLLDAVARAKNDGATPDQLQRALALQRKAQWRIDFIAAENSMGFHAPQEAARVLAEAADYARQGQIAALFWKSPAPK